MHSNENKAIGLQTLLKKLIIFDIINVVSKLVNDYQSYLTNCQILYSF